MKTVIRKGVFETNSSSTHSLTIVKGNEAPPADMEVSFEICSPVAKVFMIYGLVTNAECSCEDKKDCGRQLVLRFKKAALKALAERLGCTLKDATDAVECEAFGNWSIKKALGDEEKLRALLKTNESFAAEFQASRETDLVAFAERFFKSDLEKTKRMMRGKYRCDTYFYNGCLIDCDCGFDSFYAMVEKLGLGYFDSDEVLLQKARAFLSDDVRILCEELNAGIVPMPTGEKY